MRVTNGQLRSLAGLLLCLVGLLSLGANAQDAPGAATPNNRVALVIGNGAYRYNIDTSPTGSCLHTRFRY